MFSKRYLNRKPCFEPKNKQVQRGRVTLSTLDKLSDMSRELMSLADLLRPLKQRVGRVCSRQSSSKLLVPAEITVRIWVSCSRDRRHFRARNLT